MTTPCLVVGRTPWARQAFEERLAAHKWFYTEAERWWDYDVTGRQGGYDVPWPVAYSVEEEEPPFIFILHWSKRIPDTVVQKWRCIGFHMTPLPYGRGGTPLQNMIAKGFEETELCAFRMTPEVDAGPVYLRKPLCLHGSAEEIYLRAMRLACKMAEEIAAKKLEPKPQEGVPVVFERRRPEDSRLPMTGSSLDDWFNRIRMVDAEGYPPAFLDYGEFRLEFTRASRRVNTLIGDVTITRRGDRDGRAFQDTP